MTLGNDTLYIGKPKTLAGYNFNGKLDEFLFWSGRNLSSSELSILYNDSRNTFATTGTWTSQSQSGNEYPSMISVAYGNVSVTRTISLIQLQTPSGIVFWSHNAALTSGTSYAIIPSFPLQAVSGNWTVSLTLTGNQTGTPFVSSLTIGLQSTTAIDYTPIWILTALVVLLFLVGTKVPFIWIFSGIAGLLLAIQLLNTLADPVLSTVIAGFGVMLMIAGIFRRG
jgi:hypothetical protein